jgi:hypothetical protein
MSNKELALAPWNATRFPFNTAIFYHFHGLRIANKIKINIGFYSIPEPTVRYIYRPYFKDLKASVELLGHIGYQFKHQGIVESLPVRILRRIKRSIRFGILRTSYGVLKW